jgi:2-polyprenyl-3-methyl-5-hydroxy-6-metoxy-1,4-benzoquinol methylase
MTYYQVALDEELQQVNRAVAYYLDWAEEVRSHDFSWDFVKQYYKGLLDPTQTVAIRFRALFFATRLQPVLTYVTDFQRQYQRPPRILDLGCGFGLESILITLTGASVYGVDAWDKMVDQSSQSKERYEAQHNLVLDLEFAQESLFKFSPDETFDAVYSSATLHHIEPPDDAFKAIAHLIKPQGYFFLSDENGYSPIQQLAVQKKTGWVKPRKYMREDPQTGELYMYGNENIRPTFLWEKHMRQAHLEPKSIKYCRFLPPIDWPVERMVKFERSVRNIPLLAQLSAIGFLLTAQKTT